MQKESNNMQKQLEAEHILFQTVIDHMPAAVAIIRGSDLKVKAVNPAYTMITPHKDVIGKTLENIWRESGRKFSHLCQQVLKTGEPFYAEDDVFMIQRGPAGPVERAFFSWSLSRIWLPDDNEWGILNTSHETTSYKETEFELQNSQEQYRLVSQATNDIIWDWNLNTNQLDWNQAVEDAVNLSRDEMPHTVESWYEHIHPDDRSRVVTSVHKAIDSGEHAWSAEYRFGPVGGPYRTYLDRGIIARETGGKAHRMIGSMLDLTERRQSEQTLHETESLFRTLADNISQLAWMADSSGSIFWYNKRWHEYTGTTPEQMRGDGWKKIQHPDHIDRVVEGLKRSFEAGETYEDTFPMRAADGNYRWFLTRAVPIKDEQNNVIRWFGTNTDVTRSRKTEEALRASEAKFRSVFEQAAIGMARVRFDDATWIDVNDAFCQMLGYTKQEMLSMSWPEITHPDDIDLDLIPFKQMAAGELDSYSVEKRFIHKNKEHIWAKLTLSLVRDAHGEPDYEVAIIEDISRRKEAESMLRRYEILALQSRDIILVVDPEDGRIQEANAAAVETYGYPRSELLELGIHDLRVDGVQIVEGQMADADSEGILFETVHRRKDGSTLPVEVSSQGAVIDGRRTLVSVIRDITERKRAEEEIRRSENRFREAFAHAPVAMAMADLDGRYKEANQAFCDLLGYDREEVLKRKLKFTDVTHPDDREANIEVVDRLHAGEIPAFHIEKRYIRKDKKVIWVRTSVSVQRDASGKPYQTIGILENIDARKKAEAALRASENLFRETFEYAPVGMAITDLDGRFREANEAYCSTVGYDEDELVESGITFKDLTHHDDLGENLEVMEQMLTGKIPAFHYEKRYIRKDGEVVWVRASVTARRNEAGQPYQLVAIVEDINDRKNAERELARSRKQFEAVLTQMPVGVGLLDLDGRLVFSNGSLYDFYGGQIPSEDPNRADEWHRFDEEGNAIETERWPGTRALQGETVSPGMEFIVKAEGKENRWILESAVPFRSDSGEVIGAVVVMDDITDRKKAEAQREQLMQNLEKKTAEMERFASIIRHDFGNSIFSIEAFKYELENVRSSLHDLLESQQFDEDTKKKVMLLINEDVPDSLNFIQTAVDQLKAYLNGLRQVAAAGRVDVKLEPVNVEELVTELVGTMKHRLEETHVQLEIGNLPPCLADEDQLSMVFNNLVTNAVKYRDEERQSQIKIWGRYEGARVLYCVEDNGVGISPENQEKVFDVFYREDPSRAGGEGLGLTIVRRALERLDGTIWLKSQRGAGSKFFVSLPIA